MRPPGVPRPPGISRPPAVTALVVTALVVALAAPAHAMGVYITVGVAAWNADGTAVLLRRDEASSGTVGSSHQYTLIGGLDGSRLTVSFDDTLDPGEKVQHVDVATCARAAATLKRALADKRFVGISIDPARCKTDREVITSRPVRGAIDPAVGDLGVRRPADVREIKVDDLLKRAFGAFPAGATVESPTGALVVVMSGVNGDESGPAHLGVVAATPGGPRILVDDLR